MRRLKTLWARLTGRRPTPVTATHAELDAALKRAYSAVVLPAHEPTPLVTAMKRKSALRSTGL